MTAAVGAALKKIATSLLTNPKVLKIVCGIILGIILIIIMPIAAVIGIFNGDINIDTDRLQQMVVSNLSEEARVKLQAVEDTMYAIENMMSKAGYAGRVKEAQVLYVLVLSDYADETGFVSRLVGCFTADQTDEQLIAAVNSEFGTQIAVDDFKKVMSNIRLISIDISGYINPDTKNNLDLVEWAKQAHKSGWGYVYGTYGEVLDENLLTSKISQYSDEIVDDEKFIRQNWLGKRTADCVGLIKGYSWYNIESQNIEISSNGMPDISADTMYENAEEKGTIDTIPEIPGLAVWHEGHIGIYIGNGEVIQAANAHDGVIQTNLADTAWTHWLKVPYIKYIEQEKTQ